MTNQTLNDTFGTLEFDFNVSLIENITLSTLPVDEDVSETSKYIGFYTLKQLPFLMCEETVQSDYDSNGVYWFWAVFMGCAFLVIGYELYQIPNPEMTEKAEKFWKYLLYGYLGAGGGLFMIPICLALVQCAGRKTVPVEQGFCDSFGELTCGKNARYCVWNDSRNLCYNIPFVTPISGIIAALIPTILYAVCQLPVFRNEPGEVDWLYLEKYKLENRKMISLPAIAVMEVTDAVDVCCDALLILSFMPYPAYFLSSCVLFYTLFGLYNVKRQVIDTYYNKLYNGIYLCRWHHFLGPVTLVYQTAMDYIDNQGLVLSHIPILGCVAAYDLRINKKFMEPYLKTRFIWFSVMRTFQDIPQLTLLIIWVANYSSGPHVFPVIIIKAIQLLIWTVMILTQFRDKQGLDRETKERHDERGDNGTMIEMGEPHHNAPPRGHQSRQGSGRKLSIQGSGRRQSRTKNHGGHNQRNNGSRGHSQPHVGKNSRRSQQRQSNKGGRRNSQRNKRSSQHGGVHLYE